MKVHKLPKPYAKLISSFARVALNCDSRVRIHGDTRQLICYDNYKSLKCSILFNYIFDAADAITRLLRTTFFFRNITTIMLIYTASTGRYCMIHDYREIGLDIHIQKRWRQHYTERRYGKESQAKVPDGGQKTHFAHFRPTTYSYLLCICCCRCLSELGLHQSGKLL